MESSNAGGFMVSLEEVQWALGMGRNLPFEEAIRSSKQNLSSKMIWFEWISQQNVRSSRGMPENDRIVIKLISTSILPEHIQTKDRVLPSHRSQTTGWEWTDFPLPRPEVSQHAIRCSSLAVYCSILTVPSRSYDDTSIKLMEIFLIYL